MFSGKKKGKGSYFLSGASVSNDRTTVCPLSATAVHGGRRYETGPIFTLLPSPTQICGQNIQKLYRSRKNMKKLQCFVLLIIDKKDEKRYRSTEVRGGTETMHWRLLKQRKASD
ncbi:uncharacterized protein [Gossypium hirsutum]|uniref:Uncharacterized protein n=1 Tax=Gossypium hirsutum TaxID=3635 RepID=A0ABM3A9I4_GOSHI|nr:uncharacterized protein LOC121218401 [Gossypium hirsutum]